MDAAQRERLNRIRQLRESYEEWHRLGVAALARGDFHSVADAAQAESTIIREQKRVIHTSKDCA